MRKTISSARAYYLTTLWGSYIHSGDPGACLYGFHVDDARPQNEEHRRACIAYISGLMERNYNRNRKALAIKPLDPAARALVEFINTDRLPPTFLI